ncbi:MAG: hypothetical protein V1904_03675 [Bacteroidota bacterium]
MNKSRTSTICSKAFAFCLTFLVFQNFSKAQNEDVINIKEYTPTISDAFKIPGIPAIPDTAIEKISLIYELSPVLHSTKFAVEPIKPAKMIGEPLNKLYRSYAKLGLGTKTTSLAEYYYSNLRSTDQAIGFYFKHLASSGKIKKYAFPGFSDNDLGLYAKKFYKNHTLAADVDYNRNVVHYYGFKPADFPLITDADNKDSLKQRLMTVGGQIKFFSTYSDSSRFNHTLSLKYRNASDLYDAMEDYIAFRSSVDKNAKVLGKSFDNQNLGLKANVDFYNDHNKIDTSSSAIISLQPHFSASYNILKFNVGLNTSFSTGDSSDIFIYPVANLDLNLFNNVFILYAGIDGELEKNNLISLFSENPFINTSLSLQYTNTKSRFLAGVKGSLSSYLSFNAYISKSKVNDLPLFVNDSTFDLFNKFTVIYDDASILNTHTEITYQKAEKIKLMLISNYYEYKMSAEKRAWHKPSMDVKLAVNYNLKNKIILKAEIFALSSCDAKNYNYTGTPEVKIERLKGTVDVNLGLEYRYSKILSGFLNFNNIGAVKYQKWYNYPAYGFTVLCGVTYAF